MFDFNNPVVRDLSLEIFDNLEYTNEKNEATLYSASLIPLMCYFMLKEDSEENMIKIYQDMVKAIVDGGYFTIPAYNDVSMTITNEKDRTLRTKSLYISVLGECKEFLQTLASALQPKTKKDEAGNEELEDNLFAEIFQKGTFTFNACKYTLNAFEFINNLAQQDIVFFENKDKIRLSYFNLSLEDPQEQVRWACLITSFFIMKQSYAEKQAKKKKSF